MAVENISLFRPIFLLRFGRVSRVLLLSSASSCTILDTVSLLDTAFTSTGHILFKTARVFRISVSVESFVVFKQSTVCLLTFLVAFLLCQLSYDIVSECFEISITQQTSPQSQAAITQWTFVFPLLWNQYFMERFVFQKLSRKDGVIHAYV